MGYLNDTPLSRKNKNLNAYERGTVPQIKVNKTVIVYYPDTGQVVYEANRKNCGSKFKFLQCQAFIDHVTELFYEKHQSLDSICGAARRHNTFSKSEMVCTKTFYNYADAGSLEISNIDLPLKVNWSKEQI